MYHFCTYFDRNYLFKGVALYESLRRHSGSFRLWVLCLDDLTREVLLRLELPDVCLISLKDIEEADPALVEAKSNRSLVEYYWTCTPSLPLYIFRHQSHVDAITYLDADLFFYSDPHPIYKEFGEQSVLIIEHRFAADCTYLAEKFGTYNVGLVSFRNVEEGLRCLRSWRTLCLESCSARPADGRFADQKYLDDWPRKFKTVAVLQHKGAGLAPWNIANYEITRHGQAVMVDSDPLVFYHFHRFRIFTPYLFEQRGHDITRNQRNLVYAPYIAELQQAIRTVRSLIPDFNFGFTKFGVGPLLSFLRHYRFMFSSPQHMIR